MLMGRPSGESDELYTRTQCTSHRPMHQGQTAPCGPMTSAFRASAVLPSGAHSAACLLEYTVEEPVERAEVLVRVAEAFPVQPDGGPFPEHRAKRPALRQRDPTGFLHERLRLLAPHSGRQGGAEPRGQDRSLGSLQVALQALAIHHQVAA